MPLVSFSMQMKWTWSTILKTHNSSPLANTDNAVNYKHSCNYTCITNAWVSQHRWGGWKQTGMKQLEDAENVLWALLSGVMTTHSYQNLHYVVHLNSPVLPVGPLLALEHWRAAVLRTHSCRTPVSTRCKDWKDILPAPNQWLGMSLPSH